MYLNRIAALYCHWPEHTLQSMLVVQVLALRKNLMIVYTYHLDLLTQSVVIVCALLASQIASAGMMEDRGPLGSGNSISKPQLLA